VSKVLTEFLVLFSREKEMTYLEQINKLSSQLPLVVLQDIHNHVRDWLASGGEENDSYIGQKLRFAENYLKARGTE